MSYVYVGDEFRPLRVTDDVGISTPVVEGTRPADSEDYYSSVEQNVNDSIYSDVAEYGLSNSKKPPPPLPKPYASRSTESLNANDDGKMRKPPPLPKPYGKSSDNHDEDNAVYAVVKKPPTRKVASQSEEHKKEEEDPPPLPSRPNFEEDEELLKDPLSDEQSRDELNQNSSSMSAITKQTRNKQVGKSTDESRVAKNRHTGDAVVDVPNTPKAYIVTDIPNTPKAYIVTDIVSQPSTTMFGEPERYSDETGSNPHEKDETDGEETDLPDGWKKYPGIERPYYWHVATGRIQYEKPQKQDSTEPFRRAKHPQSVNTPKVQQKPEPITVTSFPVHSMGWVELEESQVAPHNMTDTIAECMRMLARERKDLWKTSETWGYGKDLRLLLEKDNLKLVEVQTNKILLVQPVSKMRVWGAGREEQSDFAYVARDQASGKHKCHVFRCHGNILGRAIHNKLHEMCSKILAQRSKSNNNHQGSGSRQWSDILNTPPKQSALDQVGFNVKPKPENKRSFSGKFIGKVEVPRPTGIDVVHRAIDVAMVSRDPSAWRTCLIEITVSSVRATDCLSQEIISDNRIKFVSFIGVAKDVRYCGYVCRGDENSSFLCNVFECIPNAASFTKALEEACRLRLQSCLDTNPELAEKIKEDARQSDKQSSQSGHGIKGFLGKLASQAKMAVPRRDTSDAVLSSTDEKKYSELLVKYYGCHPVSVGTGPSAIREAVT
ncbi:amyloid beta precursor protein binding family B member 1-like isoform X2 [Xenia sp. Carnegie-2017]|nr:amyloid beta precursor protein binding family B member 1-like isoform X2 [Xenia sp. Carnegie-2017]